MKLSHYMSKIQNLRLVVLGDLILDHYLKGIVTRLSPEAPVPVLDVNGGFYRLGGAANVAANLAAMGARVSLIGVTGDDLDMAKLRKLAAGYGIEPLFAKDNRRQTTRKTRVMSVSQQICRLDYETKEPINQVICDDVVRILTEELKKAGALVVVDYGKGLLTEPLLLHLEDKVVPVMPVYYSPKPPVPMELRGPKLVAVNRTEAAALIGNGRVDRPVEMCKKVQEIFSSNETMVTLGEDGLVLFAHDNTHKVKAKRHEVFDVSGAGDTVLAIYALTRNLDIAPEHCASLASTAAGFVLQEIGTCPVTWKQMKDVKF